ncbi:hypothetical protein PGT21_030034 [Puccinia graminis f. sp. tritici]|uniref:Major facilitator superfamily (MFS) profile domain-containing protein n=1 Tax=Puccinia graminis f. sp. tritici TaxID=56615 RepID=A0A5B0MMN7_PUCGR|nr:hypothetical protein PGT21_030034 [Puccinia graminis f. sp. tritici]
MGKITELFETPKPQEVYHTHSAEDGVPPLTFVVSIQQCQFAKNQEPITGDAETDNTTQDTIVPKDEPFDRQNHKFNQLDYPELPESFSWRKKWLITLLVLSVVYANAIFSSLVSTLGTKIEGELTADFISGLKGLNVPLSVFNLGNGIGTIFMAPLSERYGRVPVMRSGWMLFIILNIGCGFATNQSQLFFLRLLAGIAAGGPICLSQIILAEMWGRRARGTPCCLNSLVVVVGPSIGNVLGGWTIESFPWRWIFWATSLISIVQQILVILFLPETNKAKLHTTSPTVQMSDIKLSNITIVDDDQSQIIHPNSNSKPKSIDGKSTRPSTPVKENSTLDQHRFSQPNFLTKFIPPPLWIFFHDPLVFILSVQMGMIYALFYMVQTRIISFYHHDLKESTEMSSLHVLSMSLGAICASKLNTRGLSAICDRLRIVSERSRDRPEYKFRCMIPGILLLPIGAFCFGLITNIKSSWLLPDVGLFCLGAGVIFGFRKAGSYIIDTFGDQAASALAAMHLIRRIESFVIPLVINLTIKGRFKYELIILGSTLFSLLIVCPMPFLLFTYGPRIRRLPLSGD